MGILCVFGINCSPSSTNDDAKNQVWMIEPSTARYVFALGLARFLGCAHWIIQVYESAGSYLFLLGSGYFWLPMVFLAEAVQTFILADFCYYYVISVVNGQI
ncbi:uncharacterized protein [Rutidosis leptorrhynchoides]|uniref:uncharacterized protein n=1 Tax=Rutidosis leptorrhynchoides TaxID=125765 RepID=UPI003A99F872